MRYPVLKIFAILILIGPATTSAFGQLRPRGLSCFRSDIQSYLDEISKFYPAFANKELDYLDKQASRPTLILRGLAFSNWNWKETEFWVRITPDISFFKDGRHSDSRVCYDPVAQLVHELEHAYERQKGIADDREDKESGLALSEISATQAENKYREAKGLCPRPSYAGKRLPVWARSKKECAKPMASPCTRSVSLCEAFQCCCWIINLVAPGEVCVKQTTVDECAALNKDGVNAGDYFLPCEKTFPGVPFCK